MNNVSSTMQMLDIGSWIDSTQVHLSIGKRGTHAVVKQAADCSLKVWLQAQTKAPREGRLTAAQYATASKEERTADKAQAGGTWYSFAHYTDNHRQGDNWHGTNIVVLDADAKSGQVEGAQYSFTARQLVDRLKNLQFIALPTYSYTDACPRWRIVLTLTEVITNRTDFDAIARCIASRLDGNVDPRSYTPEQYWYSLSAPRGEWDARLGLITVGGYMGAPFDVAAWRAGNRENGIVANTDELSHAGQYPKVDAGKLLSSCANIRWYVENQEKATEPYWREAAVGVGKFCSEATVHKWSRQHPGYDLDETEKKIAGWHGTGAALCKSLEQHNPEACVGCEYRGKIKSPIVLGYTDGDLASGNERLSPQGVLESLNDAGNADRILCAHGDKLAFVADQGRWLIRYKDRWHRDAKRNIVVLTMAVMRGIFTEAAKYRSETKQSRYAAELADAIWNHGNRSLRAGAIENAIRLAETAPSIAITSDQLDSDNYLLGTRNGVIDLRTGVLRDEQREDWITRSVRTEYDRTATCPTWMAFLDGIMDGNPDLVDFLQALVGYCLTGDTREQKFFFLYGVGANGKSTFLNTLREMLGGYAVQARPETLMLAKQGAQAHGHTADLMPLIGTRFAAANETEEGQRLAESLIKQLTGGEPIMVRSPYGKDSVLVMPQFKVVMAGNHRPIIRGTDHGIWRRLVCIPFTVTIPEDRQDKGLVDKLRAEFPGILNWAVEGCLRWQRDGLNLPPVLQDERKSYMSAMDILARWIDECCEVGPGFECGVRKLYMAYAQWCNGGGFGTVSETRFSQQLDEKGYERVKTRAGMVAKGIRPRQVGLI